jgi:protein required for attachment to host cells
MEQTDWHPRAEAEFVKTIAKALDDLCRKKDVRSLILVAAPRALADLRNALTPAVRQRTVTEVDKDLTNHPLPDVAKVLAGL